MRIWKEKKRSGGIGLVGAAVTGTLCFCALPAHAMVWFCTAALVPDAEPYTLPDGLPYSPTVFELDLNASGDFTARGEDRLGTQVVSFDWDGTWIDVDGQLALIGPKKTETKTRSEMRALTTHVGQQELILNLTETAPWTKNMRCLRYDLG